MEVFIKFSEIEIGFILRALEIASTSESVKEEDQLEMDILVDKIKMLGS